jgi:hypothetical protein
MPSAKNTITLSDYVERIMQSRTPPLTAKEVERRSRNTRGETISNQYVSDVLNNPKKNLTIKYLKLLARGLGCDVVELTMVALGLPLEAKPPSKKISALINRADDLPDEIATWLVEELEMLARELDHRLRQWKVQ